MSEIAASLRITLAVAGSLVSGFAIAYAVGTPILMTLVSRLPKKADDSGGFGIANVLGVPIGTFVGQHFERQAAFILTALIGVAALVLNAIVIPANSPFFAAFPIADTMEIIFSSIFAGLGNETEILHTKGRQTLQKSEGLPSF